MLKRIKAKAKGTLAVAIMISSTMNRRLNKLTNMGSKYELLRIKRTAQTFLGNK